MVTADVSPPENYEDFIRVIHERFDQMSKTYQRIAEYLTQHPNEVAVQFWGEKAVLDTRLRIL